MKPDMFESDIVKENLKSEDISFSVLHTQKPDGTRVHQSTVSVTRNCTNLQDLWAAADALFSPESHDLLSAAASCPVVQLTQDPVAHRGHQ